MTKKYLFGGKLGDFINGLIVPKFAYDVSGEKVIIYISNVGDAFSVNIEKTYSELVDIMVKQDFVESFELYNNQPVDVHMYMFRGYPLLENRCWTDVYFDIFIDKKIRPKKNHKWLSFNKENLDGCLLINRGYVLDASTTWYNKIISQFPKEKVFFVTSDINQYKNCKLDVNLLLKPTLKELFSAINGCSVYLGDQSAPLAIASALGKDRIAELNRRTSYYMDEEKYHDNFKWFSCGYIPFKPRGSK